MLNYNDLRIGVIFVLEGDPYKVLDFKHVKMQRGKPVVQTKIKNLINGKIFPRTFHQSDAFEEADIEKDIVMFLYSHRDEYWFSDIDDKSNRFFLSQEHIGEPAKFLAPNTEVTAVQFNGKIISIEIPIKMDLKVIETPPGDKGNTASGGTKTATLETGTVVSVPLFVNTGDVVRINTETGEYSERAEKSKK
jgi:elongation factor P